jgi:hypothetical protein
MNNRRTAATIICAAILILPIFRRIDVAVDYFPSSPSDEELLKDVVECTTGLALGVATPDGRPLLWKNRDVSNSNQEFHYYDDGRIPFISITYSGETDEYYGGLNAAGFAVENSNSYNLESGPYQNGFGYGDDDGQIHRLALATCRTVDDFAALLDSLDVGGRTLNSNYGTIDAFGNAAMFETAGYSYTRCDAADAPGGFLVRANYSYSGRDVNNRNGGWGDHRHDAAYALFRQAVERHELTAQYIYQRVIRDLSIEGIDPYPLPFDGYVSNYGYGLIPNGEAVCRSITRGVLVVQGVREGARPDDAILWAMAGSPLTTVALPLWVRAGSVPTEFNGPNGSRICARGQQLSGWVYSQGAVNTWHLTTPNGTGLWDYTLPLERWIFNKTERFVRSRDFSYDRLEAFQNELAAQVADSLESWKATRPVTEFIQPIYTNEGLRLAWGNVNPDPRFAPIRFHVYRSALPFRDGEPGSRIATVEGSTYLDQRPLPGMGFYRVEEAL